MSLENSSWLPWTSSERALLPSKLVKDQFIPGLGRLRKARATPIPGRDFAAVMVQTPQISGVISILSAYSIK